MWGKKVFVRGHEEQIKYVQRFSQKKINVNVHAQRFPTCIKLHTNGVENLWAWELSLRSVYHYCLYKVIYVLFSSNSFCREFINIMRFINLHKRKIYCCPFFFLCKINTCDNVWCGLLMPLGANVHIVSYHMQFNISTMFPAIFVLLNSPCCIVCDNLAMWINFTQLIFLIPIV